MWIQTVEPEDAREPLKTIYDDAVRRAGRVFNILKCMSLHPPAIEAMLRSYQTFMFGASPLSRAQREMLAVVVSAANECRY